MAGFRLPGPVCAAEQPWALRDGTSILWRTPPPGGVCVASSAFKLAVPVRATSEPDLSFLFRQCLNPVRGLADADYRAAAERMAVEVAAIRAVAEVETSGQAFDDAGRPRILFERHKFHRFTGGRFAQSHPRVSARTPGGYTKNAEYAKLEEAYGLDADAALRAASWGRFQVMGFNFAAAGHPSVRRFVLAMTRSEAEHLHAFVAFIGSDAAMAQALRDKDWAGFARRYNGADYAKNRYDAKLQAAYDAHARQARDAAEAR